MSTTSMLPALSRVLSHCAASSDARVIGLRLAAVCHALNTIHAANTGVGDDSASYYVGGMRQMLIDDLDEQGAYLLSSAAAAGE